MIELIDLKAVFIDGVDSAGGVSKDAVIRLSDINCPLTNLDPDGVNEFKDEVQNIIIGSRSIRSKTKPDPIAALLMNADLNTGNEPIDEEAYNLFERSRLADKWRGNKIGKLNELMACMLPNIIKSESGRLDLQVTDREIIAEMKNRFNTMNAASAIKTRKNMESIVFDNNSVFKGYQARLVERIPKSDGVKGFFSPSDPDRGMKTTDSDFITRQGFQQFLTECGGPLVYLQGIFLIASVLVENQLLPRDYDMNFIFRLLKESIS
ncbi:Eco47II family restriction endonuclease [Pseudoalteromonas sp. A22]|uniref:Eco47II family restriction endonuclease n=1 Tax=Pseudoalteromonas sp. A22 TaxID=327511 RepID=UPI001BAC289C|nr:Eco47II family restriction endonuclease [Pseudoalteromonas sp. A22]QUI64880.1 Eco47II family restriction endonuclease [Pseudoalteromonas sp. A22]